MPGTGPAEGHRSVGEVIKETFTAAPWSDHHDKTLEALTHAKIAHHKAYEAQLALKAASESKAKSDQAQRRLEEVRDICFECFAISRSDFVISMLLTAGKVVSVLCSFTCTRQHRRLEHVTS